MNEDVPPRVLLIEDNEIDREAVARLVGEELSILEAASGAEGKAVFEAERPDCVLLDYWLPDAEGLDLLQWFVARHAAVIVFTGQGNESLAVEAMKNGAMDYMIKGELTRDMLRRAVSGAMTRRTLETALKQSKGYNRALLEAIPDMIFRVRRDGTFLDYIPGEGAAPYRPPSEFLGSTVAQTLPPELVPSIMATIERAFTERRIQRLDYALETSGGRRSYEARVTMCGDHEVLVITRDMTEQRNLEQRVRASQRMEAVGRLAGGIAHDFSNVLTLIQGYTDLLLEEFADDERVRKDLTVMWDATERGAKLIRQLLAFSRRQAQQLEVLSLDLAIRDMSNMLRYLIRESIELVLELDCARDPIEVDPTQLDQILMNLVVNARDAMPEGGTLTIRTRRVEMTESDVDEMEFDMLPGGYVLLEVSDTGLGMDAETQSRIFEPFFTTKPQGQGTGLGLATVYGIIKQSNGFITVTSEPGQGTTFDVYFPRVERELTSLPLRRRGPVVLTGDETVLLVEDQEEVRRAVCGILERNGYHVLEADSASQAVSQCMTYDGPVHLLLTDLVMPRVNGLELADDLAACLPGLHVLYMTGYTEDILAEHGMDDSDIPVLEKPFTPEDLLRKVREILDQ